jgi:transcriptional regulator with PAS, ATPase and Fis domain
MQKRPDSEEERDRKTHPRIILKALQVENARLKKRAVELSIEIQTLREKASAFS